MKAGEKVVFELKKKPCEYVPCSGKKSIKACLASGDSAYCPTHRTAVLAEFQKKYPKRITEFNNDPEEFWRRIGSAPTTAEAPASIQKELDVISKNPTPSKKRKREETTEPQTKRKKRARKANTDKQYKETDSEDDDDDGDELEYVKSVGGVNDDLIQRLVQLDPIKTLTRLKVPNHPVQ